MFISKSLRIFALTILLVPMAQPAMALSPRMKDYIAHGIGRTVISAYLAGACTFLINMRSWSKPSEISFKQAGYAALLGGLFSALWGLVECADVADQEAGLKRTRERCEEILHLDAKRKAQTQYEKARKDYKVAAEHAAGYARIRNDQRAQKVTRDAALAAARTAHNHGAYNASLESSRAQRLVQSCEYNEANRSVRAQRLMK